MSDEKSNADKYFELVGNEARLFHEIQHLKQINDDLRARIAQSVDESIHLERVSELKCAYTQLLKERDTLKAEVERLNNMTQKQYQMEWAIAVKERDELKAEVERLKLKLKGEKSNESISRDKR